MYSIHYRTRHGSSINRYVSTLDAVEAVLRVLFDRRITAKVMKDGREIGKCWKDGRFWNWVLDLC